MLSRGATTCAVVIAALSGLAGTAVADTTVERISVSSAEVGGDGGSASPAVNASGTLIAFTSDASNLVANDTDNVSDIFVRDTVAGVTTRVSLTNLGGQANGASREAAISDGGRYIAFTSDASNLVAGDTNGVADVFVRDRAVGTTVRVGVGSAGQANGLSHRPSISQNGRFVAFASEATNLVAGDTNRVGDVFVRDRVAGVTTRVSVRGASTQANGASDRPALSGNGRFVAFETFATNLTGGAAGPQVVVRTLAPRINVLVSLPDAGGRDPAISDDGRFVAFVDDFIQSGYGPVDGIMFWDRTVGTAGPFPIQDGVNVDPAISGNGDVVAMTSLTAPALGSEYTLVADRVAGTAERLPGPTGYESFHPALNLSGDRVAFDSFDSGWVPGDTTDTQDVFVATLGL